MSTRVAQEIVNRTTMSDAEVSAIKGLLAEIESQYRSVDDPGFLVNAPVLAHELPRRLRKFLNDFKQLEPRSGHCIISAYPVSDSRIGRTPSHWQSRPRVSPTLEEEMLFVLFASLLGDVIGWATQQNGYIVHDVLPIKADEDSQISTGSLQTITWHNEDAFHPYRGDYVGLMCLRNPDNVPTTLAPIDMVHLDERLIEHLFEPRFVIHPDESHSELNKADKGEQPEGSDYLIQAAYRHINEMRSNPKKFAILYGDRRSPYICIDPYFMSHLDDDVAQSALEALIKAIDAKLFDLTLQPGEYLFVDNYKAVHGRKPFKPRYDGTDRWFKRTNIARDLRKSRDSRITSESRIIY